MRQLAQTQIEAPRTLGGDNGLEAIFENVLNIAIGIAGVALFIMLIVGGFKYITSGGDSKAAASAQQTITWAILGLALLASAYLILRLIANFTGVQSILDFQIYQS